MTLFFSKLLPQFSAEPQKLQKLTASETMKSFYQKFKFLLKNGFFGAAAVSGLFLLIEHFFSKNLLIKKSGNRFRRFPADPSLTDHTVEKLG